MEKKETQMSKDNGIVAVRLAEILKDIGIRQKFLAEKMGVTPKSITDMLNGKKLIKVSDIERILKALEPYSVTINDLFEERE